MYFCEVVTRLHLTLKFQPKQTNKKLFFCSSPRVDPNQSATRNLCRVTVPATAKKLPRSGAANVGQCTIWRKNSTTGRLGPKFRSSSGGFRTTYSPKRSSFFPSKLLSMSFVSTKVSSLWQKFSIFSFCILLFLATDSWFISSDCFTVPKGNNWRWG